MAKFSRVRKLETHHDFADSHQAHVLAVDDSHVDRKVIETLLKITSCKVTAVDSGRRALQFLGLDTDDSAVGFHGLKVDLIITDYCMPGMTGYELLKKIKGSSNFREIPVVIMSSENVLARIDRCLEEGAEDFIVKPVKLSDVKRLKSCMLGEGGRRKEDNESSPPSQDNYNDVRRKEDNESSPSSQDNHHNDDLSTSSSSRPSSTRSQSPPSNSSSPRTPHPSPNITTGNR